MKKNLSLLALALALFAGTARAVDSFGVGSSQPQILAVSPTPKSIVNSSTTWTNAASGLTDRNAIACVSFSTNTIQIGAVIAASATAPTFGPSFREFEISPGAVLFLSLPDPSMTLWTISAGTNTVNGNCFDLRVR